MLSDEGRDVLLADIGLKSIRVPRVGFNKILGSSEKVLELATSALNASDEWKPPVRATIPIRAPFQQVHLEVLVSPHTAEIFAEKEALGFRHRYAQGEPDWTENPFPEMQDVGGWGAER